jgi:hypothetical protein
VIQGGEAMLLAGFLYAGQLFGLKLVTVNISPVVGRGIHGEARSYTAIGADDAIRTPGTPSWEIELYYRTLGEMHLRAKLIHEKSARPTV